jgi:hypothetical protein
MFRRQCHKPQAGPFALHHSQHLQYNCNPNPNPNPKLEKEPKESLVLITPFARSHTYLRVVGRTGPSFSWRLLLRVYSAQTWRLSVQTPYSILRSVVDTR